MRNRDVLTGGVLVLLGFLAGNLDSLSAQEGAGQVCPDAITVDIASIGSVPIAGGIPTWFNGQSSIVRLDISGVGGAPLGNFKSLPITIQGNSEFVAHVPEIMTAIMLMGY